MTTGPAPWSMTGDDVRNGRRNWIRREQSPVTCREYLRLLAEDRDFAGWYTDTLAACPFGAGFWEHPALTSRNVDAPAEFVLLDAPALAGVPPDPRPFKNVFKSPDSAAPVLFPSLGKDAFLIAPGPGVGLQAGPHLLTFLRQASRDQVLRFWSLVGRAVLERLSETPLWLSTSGLGVSWLHVRLDSIPKYYQYGPYRTAAVLGEC